MTHYKASLAGKKGVITRLINLIQKSVEEDAIHLMDLENAITRIKLKHQALLEFWIVVQIKSDGESTTKEFESMATDMYQYEFEYKISLEKLNRHAHKLTALLTPQTPKTVVNVQLPNIKLIEFDGDYNHWKTFWLSFESHVHANLSIPKVSKYQFLSSSVRGQALKVLQNYQVTDSGHDAAVAALET